MVRKDGEYHVSESILSYHLDAQKIPNQYKPSTFHPILILPKVVTFTSLDPERFPVPSLELLALHEACCKVGQLSGAVEYLDKYDRDIDDLDVLAPDGASFGALHHAIWKKLGRSVGIGMWKQKSLVRVQGYLKSVAIEIRYQAKHSFYL